MFHFGGTLSLNVVFTGDSRSKGSVIMGVFSSRENNRSNVLKIERSKMIDYPKRRAALLDGIDADAFLVFDLDRILPRDIDRVSLFYLTGYTGGASRLS